MDDKEVFNYTMTVTVIKEFICDIARGRDDCMAEHIYSSHNSFVLMKSKEKHTNIISRKCKCDENETFCSYSKWETSPPHLHFNIIDMSKLVLIIHTATKLHITT